ncbi:MAG: hypothetical protein RI903_153 [Bacteroidota bacterium]
MYVKKFNLIPYLSKVKPIRCLQQINFVEFEIMQIPADFV